MSGNKRKLPMPASGIASKTSRMESIMDTTTSKTSSEVLREKKEVKSLVKAEFNLDADRFLNGYLLYVFFKKGESEEDTETFLTDKLFIDYHLSSSGIRKFETYYDNLIRKQLKKNRVLRMSDDKYRTFMNQSFLDTLVARDYLDASMGDQAAGINTLRNNMVITGGRLASDTVKLNRLLRKFNQTMS